MFKLWLAKLYYCKRVVSSLIARGATVANTKSILNECKPASISDGSKFYKSKQVSGRVKKDSFNLDNLRLLLLAIANAIDSEPNPESKSDFNISSLRNNFEKVLRIYDHLTNASVASDEIKIELRNIGHDIKTYSKKIDALVERFDLAEELNTKLSKKPLK